MLFSDYQLIPFGHYPVSVISEKSEDVAGLLAPYQENNMGTCPKEYLSFVYAKSIYDEGGHSGFYESFDDFIDDCGFDFDMEHEAYGRYENPNAKWDFYTIGGNYEMLIPKLDGSRAYRCKIGEIDRGRQELLRKEALLTWDSLISPVAGRNPLLCEQLLQIYGDRERYADKHMTFATGALVMPDGNWYELGRRGSIQDDTTISRLENYYFRFQKALEEMSPDYWLTVVDCHI